MLDDQNIRDLDWITLKTLRHCTYIKLINILNTNIVPTINLVVSYNKFLVEHTDENDIEVGNSCVEDVHKFHATASGSQVFLSPSFGSTLNIKVTCFRCAEVGHIAAKCPLPRNSLKCQKCGKVGHVTKAGMQKDKLSLRSAEADCANFVDNVTVAVVSSKVHSPAVSPPNVDLSYLGADSSSLHNESLFLVSDQASILHTKPYSVRLQGNNVLMQFEIDSGCSRTHNLDTYTTNFANYDNGPCFASSTLRTWASQSLTIIGEFQAVVKYKHFNCNLLVLVVDGVGPNLGRNWFQASDISIQGPHPHIDINTAVSPLYQRARSVAFALNTQMEEAIETDVKRRAYTVLPFGLKIASSAFQRIIDGLLGPVKGFNTYQVNMLKTVKYMLISHQILAHYNPDVPLAFTADASPVGVGAVLVHIIPGAQPGKTIEMPIAYTSRTLSATEQAYS
ncbi:hypothetical protein PR048_002965 [Dryococelus australis]|uniref:CCHC-type domain-containing protein n=1 Tax=Dryococelus australis TaxID=614101 RepID=A0ABQ9ILQ2_9NEOP|nr:hypothetical protein PR048_002965 [Dryococelus australis]